MSKEKVNNSIFYVLFEGLKIYFSNIDKFLLYMLFPVFGQVIGLVLSLVIPFALMQTITDKVENPLMALAYLILLAVPGLLIFTKAFWNYLVAYIALNSMTEGALTSGKVYDFQSHNEVATRRSFAFILLLLVVGVLSSVGSTIFFIIPGFVIWIYLILVFQVFTFEPDLNISEIFKRSFNLVKGNWFRTFLILAFLSFFSIYIISQGFAVIFDFLNLTTLICGKLDEYTSLLPLEFVNDFLNYFNLQKITPAMISHVILSCVLTFLVMGLTLPIRSICWTLWYVNLSQMKLSAGSKDKPKTAKTSRRKPVDREE